MTVFSGIRKLQCILLKVCLILGVQVYAQTSFDELLEPTEGILPNLLLICKFCVVLKSCVLEE